MSTTAGTIKHRHQSALAPGTSDVDVPQWNDSLVVAGGTTGDFMVRDSANTDGWGLQPAGSLMLTNATLANPTITGLEKFGGSTSAFPALKANGTTLEVRLADDSGLAPLSSTNLTLATAGVLSFSTRSQITSSADGNLRLANAAGTDFGLLRLGGTTNAFPALKRTGAGIDLRLADDSGSAALGVGAITTSGSLLFSPDNTYDVGASGATRPRSGYFGTNLNVAGVISAGPSISGNAGDLTVNRGTGQGVIFFGSLSHYIWMQGAVFAFTDPVQVNGKLTPETDNALDIGGTTQRWKDGYFGTSVKIGTNPATTGAIRLANNSGIYARESTNTADVNVISLNSGNEVVIGASTNNPYTKLNTSGHFYFYVGGTPIAHWNTSALYCDVATINLGEVSSPWWNGFLSGYLESAEITTPAAPAANKGRLYFDDNGSGKTRLMVLFNTGAAQQIAIQP